MKIYLFYLLCRKHVDMYLFLLLPVFLSVLKSTIQIKMYYYYLRQGD